ncbi:MAG: hypothetical protein NXH80_17365 [Rhodobacteraceae bacterium]|nr:hypothetical protein [Paracoccaceae bacterium]
MFDLYIDTPSARVVFGGIATALSLVAYAPYIVNTLRGHTRPHRACWLIWSVLATISFFSQFYEGATASLGFAAAQAGCTTLIFLLAVIRGQGPFMKRADAGVLGIACVGLLIWYETESAAYSLVTSITISLLGGLLTVAKVYWSPQSETMSTWTMSFVASGFALMAVGTLDWLLLAYPLYLFVLNGSIMAAWLLAQMPAQRERQRQMGMFVSYHGRPQIGE